MVALDIVISFFKNKFPFEADDITFITRCELTHDIIIELLTLEDSITIEPFPEKDMKCLLINGIDGSSTQADIAKYLHEHCGIAMETIKNIQFGTKKGAAVIQFDSSRPDADCVLSQNPHSILGRKLTVEPFFASLQAKSINEITSQEPLIFNNLDRHIVVWPCEKADGNYKSEKHLKVICAIDPCKTPVETLKESLKNWQHICSGKIQQFFHQFEMTSKIPVADQGRIISIGEVIHKIQCRITCKTLDLLKTPETKAYITDMIDKSIGGTSKACYGVDIDNNVEVCATDEESLTEAIKIIQDSIKEIELKSLTLRHRVVLCGHDGDNLFTSLQKKHKGLFLSYKSNDSISFVTISPIIDEVEEMISLFIDSHEIISEFIEVESDRLAYLLTNKTNELEIIEDEYQPKGIEISVVEGMISGFSIKGEKQYCREIGLRLQLMVDIIVERSHELQWDGFNECLKENQELQSKMSVIELENKCVVRISPNEKYRRTNDNVRLIDTKFFTTIGSLNKSLYVVAGDITDLDADVAVVPSISSLELSGTAGRLVRAKGGFEIQKECYDIVKYKRGRISPGDVYVTTSGNLSVKHLIHAVIPCRDDLEQDADKILASLVDQSILKAAALGGKSILFPLIGTGDFNFALEKVAEVLLTNIMTIFKEDSDIGLERVYICDLDEEKLEKVIMQAKQMSDNKDSDDSGEIPTNRQSEKSIKCDVIMKPLAELQADAFVNATTWDINLRIGALGRAILDVAGDEVLEDIKRTYPDGVRYGEVAISNTGRMKHSIEAFFHGQIPHWTPNDGFAEIVLSKFVTECLLEANRRSFCSIAFPALGCGKRGYPPDVVVTIMLRAINEFARQNPGTTVDLVKFVIPQNRSDLFEVFYEFVYENKSMKTRSFVREYFLRSRSVNNFLLQRDSPQIQVGPVSIKLTLGNITMEGTHAIVNSTNVALNLKRGLVSSMILLAAGKVIQLECNTDEKKKQAQLNKIVTTGPGRLLCKKILHMVAGESIQQWRKCIKRCLRTAEAENLPIVSFPAIGTGQCGQPASDMADVLATTVKKYVQSTKYRVMRNESHAIEADVKFHIFAETEKDAERVIQELHSLKTEEKIAFPSSVVGRLTESQEHDLIEIAKRRRTVIGGIDRKDGCIAVSGFDCDVEQTRHEIEIYLAKQSNVPLPDRWNMNVFESPKLIELQQDDSEYKTLHNLCHRTLPSGTYIKYEERKRELTQGALHAEREYDLQSKFGQRMMSSADRTSQE
ncbi:PAR14-like protein [Mya arenaria]|uniref:PAR14-like protein n=1 Tax=Mya arenaria TaxID=6604 RepID=A0ABY7E407_MYAAR|nr:PAR14-like protein [Mya arenaria]